MIGNGNFFKLSCLPKRNICCSPARGTIEFERNSWVILACLQMENHSKIKGLYNGSASFVSAKYLFNNTLIFLISHIRVHLKETAQKKKSVSELVPRQFYISGRLQWLCTKILYGLWNLHILFILFPSAQLFSYCSIYQQYKVSQTVVCGQHVLNS